MGLFSFTDEQLAAYKARQPTDPRECAAAAMQRLDAKFRADARKMIAEIGPHAALRTDGTAMMHGALDDVLREIVGGGFGARTVMNYWRVRDVAERLNGVRRALADQFRGMPAAREKAATDAAAAWQALEIAEAAASQSPNA